MTKKIGEKMCIVLVLVLTFFIGVGISFAQDYPKSPVQIVIPFGPGGLTDILWRSISEFIGANLKGTIVLLNKPGGGGVVGTSFVANSKADGYVLVSANSDPLTISPLFTPDVPYNPEKDLTYIAKLAVVAFGIAVRSESPFKTVEDLVAFAKANPKKLKAGGMGIGSTPHIILEVFNQEAKMETAYVPFDSGGETVTNLLGGHTDFGVVSLPPVNPHVLSGKARLLAVCSPKRLPGFPQVPTLGEKGYKKSSIATGVGLAGPKDLPPAIVNQWGAAIEKTLKDQKVIDIIEKLEGAVVDYQTGEGFKKELMADLETFKTIIPAIKAKK